MCLLYRNQIVPSFRPCDDGRTFLNSSALMSLPRRISGVSTPPKTLTLASLNTACYKIIHPCLPAYLCRNHHAPLSSIKSSSCYG